MAFELNQEVFDALTETCITALKKRSVSRVDDMLNLLMDVEGVFMHCPYHHYIVPAALLTMAAMENYQKEDQLREWLATAESRAKDVPGGVCGNCGNCGSSVGCGIFLSVYTGASPMSVENWKWANELTGKCLIRVSSYGGPRCCKRTCYLALLEAVPYINDHLGLNLRINEDLICKYWKKNEECLRKLCPFHEWNPRNTEAGFPIIVPEQKLPKRDPSKDCKCMSEPIDIEDADCYLEWLKKSGEKVVRGEVVCEAEVNKRTIEFEAEVDGILTHCIEDGDRFKPGTVLGVIRASKA